MNTASRVLLISNFTLHGRGYPEQSPAVDQGFLGRPEAFLGSNFATIRVDSRF